MQTSQLYNFQQCEKPDFKTEPYSKLKRFEYVVAYIMGSMIEDLHTFGVKPCNFYHFPKLIAKFLIPTLSIYK